MQHQRMHLQVSHGRPLHGLERQVRVDADRPRKIVQGELLPLVLDQLGAEDADDGAEGADDGAEGETEAVDSGAGAAEDKPAQAGTAKTGKAKAAK